MPDIHYLTSWNADFDAPQYAARNGVDWTLHLDKAQPLSFEQACRALDNGWFPGASATTVEEVLRVEVLVCEATR